MAKYGVCLMRIVKVPVYRVVEALNATDAIVEAMNQDVESLRSPSFDTDIEYEENPTVTNLPEK